MAVVGLHGLPGSGKDVIVQRLELYSRLPVHRKAFADKMKQSMCALLGITLEQFEDFKRHSRDFGIGILEHWGGGEYQPILGVPVFDARQFIQRYGTEAHREVFGYDFWIDQCLPFPHSGTATDAYGGNLVVVTDVRFPNEADRVLDLGGEMWRVVGPDSTGSTHVSDQHLDLPFTEIINNIVRDDDFAWLDAQLRVALKTRGFFAIKGDEAVASRSAAGS